MTGMMDNSQSQPSGSASLQVLVEELACTIATGQAALFAGRFGELESCARRLQALCQSVEALETENNGKMSGPSGKISADPKVVATAEIAREQNRLFAALLRRMQRHLGTLRSVLSGRSLSYGPANFTRPGQDR
jgi:hypothetical protein